MALRVGGRQRRCPDGSNGRRLLERGEEGRRRESCAPLRVESWAQGADARGPQHQGGAGGGRITAHM
eukprot:6810408-Pyramimonas_sp.AAC.1